jgi:hypothetical protein
MYQGSILDSRKLPSKPAERIYGSDKGMLPVRRYHTASSFLRRKAVRQVECFEFASLWTIAGAGICAWIELVIPIRPGKLSPGSSSLCSKGGREGRGHPAHSVGGQLPRVREVGISDKWLLFPKRALSHGDEAVFLASVSKRVLRAMMENYHEVIHGH